MKWNKQFNYPESTRSIIHGQRHYDVDNMKLPSVTTILSATQPEEKKRKLAEWQQKVGKLRQSVLEIVQRSVVQSCIGF